LESLPAPQTTDSAFPSFFNLRLEEHPSHDFDAEQRLWPMMLGSAVPKILLLIFSFRENRMLLVSGLFFSFLDTAFQRHRFKPSLIHRHFVPTPL